MADREIVRPPFPADFPGISSAGFRYLQQLAQAINLIRGGTTHGNPTDYTEIEKDGTVRFYGEATTWQDINFDIGALSVAAGSSGPTYATLAGGTIKRAQFLNSRLTEVNGALEVDHEVRLVTIKPHFHALALSAATGNVKFSLAYTVTNGGQTEPVETVISATFPMVGVTGRNYSVGFPDIDVSSSTAGCQFSFRFYRDPADAADTHAADVAIKTIGLHVEIQSFGTRDVIDD